VKPDALRSLLQEFYRDKLALYRRHEAGAALVSSYEFNNAYQYILAREDAQLSWLRRAIEEMGGTVDNTVAVPPVPASSRNAGDRAVLEDDAERAREFIQRWSPRVRQVTHARHRRMLELILGEVAEHQRSFEQAAAGRLDVLGRRPLGAGTGGGVLATRWME